MKRRNSKESTLQSKDDFNEKGLLNELFKNQKSWGLDLYQADQHTDLLNSMQNNQFQAIEIVDYLEEYVVPFLESYACDEEKRALKRWVFQTRGRLEKVRREHLSHDFDSETDHFDSHIDDNSDNES